MYEPCNQVCPYNTLRGCTILEHPGKFCPMGNMQSKEEYKPITNGDRIRAMTDEELAKAVLAISDCSDICQCGSCVWHTSPLCNSPIIFQNELYGWLKQPAEEEK